MSPELHQRVRLLFDAALERPEGERALFVEQACGGDPLLFQEVSRLLGAHQESDSFLEGGTTRTSLRIDRYVIKGELGHGAMGIVYEAVDPLIGRTVAIKVISLDATDPKDIEFMRESLFREARSAGVLFHPGIVIVFDVGQENDAAFIAMERVEGPTLQQVLEGGGIMNPSTALDILRQAAAALDYAHQNGVVHRDVKPANIMLHKGSIVKIADFGIAKLATANSHTRTGTMMGTPSYMSPDQIEMRPLDGRCDQFSLAVVAYEILTGVRPFREELLPALLHAIVFGKRPSARAVNPNLPVGVDAVLERALSRFPEERYATCAEFAAALEACYPRQPLPATATLPVPAVLSSPGPPTPVPSTPLPLTPPPAPPAAVTRSRSVLPLVLAGAAVFTLLCGFLLYKFLIPSHGDQSQRVIAPPDRVTTPVDKVGKAPDLPAQPPVVASFTAEPAAIEAGAASTLRWTVTGATEVTIDQGVGKVDPSGSFEVKPQAATTYTLAAKGTGGDTTATVAIGVTPVSSKPPVKDVTQNAPPKIPLFRTEPTSLKRGERFQLTWAVDGASQVVIDHGVGAVPPGGTRTLLADATTTYTLTATGAGGTAKGQTTVTVAVETAAEIYEEAVAARDTQQPSKALTLFQLSANRGEPRAMLELGLMYRSGKGGVSKDVQQSVVWLEKSANAGNSSAMDYMGAMYASGVGTPKDDRKAMSWYSKAAAAGNAVGMDALGQMYMSGRGVAKQDYSEAVRWFGQAAAGGNPAAMLHLGGMYEKGLGVDRNLNEALSYYRKAAAAGNAEAEKRVAELRGQPGQAGMRKVTIRVAGNVAWTDTGLDLQPGDQVTAAADGMVRFTTDGRIPSAPPAGLMANCSTASTLYGRTAGAFPAPTLPCWSLLGRTVGAAPMLLEIGKSKSFTATSAGRLYLGPNDDSLGDNSGSWNVVLTVTKN